MPDVPERPLALGEDLLNALHQSPLPFALIDADAMTVVDVNRAARELLGALDREVKEFPLRDVLVPEQVHAMNEALRLLADGGLEAYEARRSFLRADGSVIDAYVWVQSMRDVMPFAALAIFAPESDDHALPADLDRARVAQATPVVVGSLDVELRVKRVSADTQEILGRRADALIGTSFVEVVHPDDVAAFLMAVGRALSQGTGVGLRLRVGRADGDHERVDMLITPMRGGSSASLGFVLGRAAMDADAEPRARASQLEQRLWRIALEVQAAGVMDALQAVPEHPQVPPAHDLSSRQWEVLARLQRGERVPGIARDMYVSQSTVRNHLAAIFRKTGVHSQAELLARLRENRHSV